ncbi:hypothetical protein AAHE18_07G145900 [Arachis hypogaea]
MYTLEFLFSHEARCYQSFRIKKDVFKKFCDTLKDIGNFKSGKKFNTVLKTICKLGSKIIRLGNQTTTHPRIMGDSRFFPYFKVKLCTIIFHMHNWIGAIDGIYDLEWAPASKQTAFRERKILITQNILAVCDLDMLYTFIYSGWEGTTNDSRVLIEVFSSNANMYQFYLVNSGFPNMLGYLALYHKERYHLRDFSDGRRARGKQELFNYRHSSLRNVTEKCFGVLKAKFPILKLMPNYLVTRQTLTPSACCTIHNFIRLEHDVDNLF